jgi:TPR repeat protein
MKILTAAIITAAMLLSAAHAADFWKGIDAANRGDYATALQEWKPLAEQGHASAQYNLGVMYANGYGVTQDC